CFIEQSSAKNKRRTKNRSGKGVYQRKQPAILNVERPVTRGAIQRNDQTESQAQYNPRLGKQIREELGLRVGEDQPDQQKAQNTKLQCGDQRSTDNVTLRIWICYCARERSGGSEKSQHECQSGKQFNHCVAR